MSRYPLSDYSAQHHAQTHATDSSAFLKVHDDRESQSPSDDGSAYLTYTKDETELEGE